jgi:HEPN domain-containing protein
MGEFMRDPSDWLRRLSPDEWIRAGLGELRRAEESYGRGDARAGTVGVKRAAGMALNAVLLVEPKESWGRTYVDHVGALATDQNVPEAVRAACRTLLDAAGPSAGVVSLRTPRTEERVLEAARDVIAHAWAVVKRHEQTNG